VLLPQLKRIRWAVRAALFLGVAASVAANILHAREDPISQAISAWPPMALLLTVELTSRIPMHKKSLAFLRVVATAAIAGIAAWVSYWHMQGVAVRYGETETSAYLLPVSVDGLIVVASVSLVELAGRIRFLEERREEQKAATLAAKNAALLSPVAPAPPATLAPQFVAPAPLAQPRVAQPQYAQPQVAQTVAVQPTHAQALADGGSVSTTAARAVNSAVVPSQPVSMRPRTAVSPLSGKPLTQQTGAHAIIPQGQPAQGAAAAQAAPVSPAVPAAKPVYVNGSTPPPQRPAVTRAAVSTSARTIVTSPTTRPAESTTPRQRRPVQETAELADEIEAMHPEISHTELARRLGISATRLRAVRREAREVRRAGAARR
jgi:hypothetical protein